MGKGFNNYMTKKFFHPGSKENIKRVWEAEQKTEFEKKKQDNLLAQYQKEQEFYLNRSQLGDKTSTLGLNFIYDPPPGLRKEEKDEKVVEYKFEWQRKYNAPREEFARTNEDIVDQPFGIEVKNVRCIKCQKWGHVNTDRTCPLFSVTCTMEPPQLKSKSSKPAEDSEMEFIKSLTEEQKAKLLRKLDKISRKEKKKHKTKKDEKKGKEPKEEVEMGGESKEGKDFKRSAEKIENSGDEKERESKRYGDDKRDKKIKRDRSYNEDRESKRERDYDRDRDNERYRESKRFRDDKRDTKSNRDRNDERERKRNRDVSESEDLSEDHGRHKRNRVKGE